MSATVSLSELIKACGLYPQLKRAPAGARSLNPSPVRRLRVLTLAAADNILMVEAATIRTTINASGMLEAVTVDARHLERALGMHSAEFVELENVGGLRVKSGRFSTTTPAV